MILLLLACVHVTPIPAATPTGCQLAATFTTTIYLGAAVELNAGIGRNRVRKQAEAAGNRVVASEANVLAFQRATFRADAYRCP